MKMENDLGRDPIPQLVLRIAIPSMLAQFVSVLYSVVDRMYIGNIAEVGKLALAGAGICGPIVTMIGSVAFLVGVGGSPLMSIRMGAGDHKAAQKILANCFLLLSGFALVLMVLALATRKPMLLLFGASETTLPYAMQYYTLYLLGTPFALLGTGLNQFIICQGFAKKGMQAVMLGALLNIALDPIFIFGLKMGVAGAALATVISQLGTCVFVIALGQFTRNYTQTVKRAADNKRRYAPGWVHSTCLLRGFPKGAAPHLAHDFAEQSVVCYTLCRRCPENTVAAGEGKGI